MLPFKFIFSFSFNGTIAAIITGIFTILSIYFGILWYRRKLKAEKEEYLKHNLKRDIIRFIILIHQYQEIYGNEYEHIHDNNGEIQNYYADIVEVIAYLKINNLPEIHYLYESYMVYYKSLNALYTIDLQKMYSTYAKNDSSLTWKEKRKIKKYSRKSNEELREDNVLSTSKTTYSLFKLFSKSSRKHIKSISKKLDITIDDEIKKYRQAKRKETLYKSNEEIIKLHNVVYNKQKIS